jgi:hypothetical protein
LHVLLTAALTNVFLQYLLLLDACLTFELDARDAVVLVVGSPLVEL